MQQADLNTLSDEEFRARLRLWIASNYRSAHRNPLRRLAGDEAHAWIRAQWRDGWRAPGLPREHGGMGLSLRKQLIYQEELEHYGTARPLDHGLRLLAPVLLRYGTPAQIAELLPRALANEDIWCQGYSEPGAGSDLASLRTSAVEQGDVFIVNGQKIWTSMASDANRIFLLVRTSTESRKQQGITFLMADLTSPGVRVRPIRTLAGDEHFCEVFFDDVAVPRANVVGEVNNGWTVGKALLGFERFGHGSPELIRFALKVFRETGVAMGLADSERHQAVLARHVADVMDASALYEQVCETALDGGDADDDFSMLKLFNAECLQRIVESATECAGLYGGVLGNDCVPGLAEDLEWLYMITRPLTIFGGTAQIQRNLIATRALGTAEGLSVARTINAFN